MSAAEPGATQVDRSANTPSLRPDWSDSERAAALASVLKLSAGVLAASAVALPLAVPDPARAWGIHGVFLVFTGVAFAMLRAGRVRGAGAALSLGFWLASSIAVFLFGGVRSPGLFVYLPVVLTAGMFWSRSAAWGLVVGSALVVILAAQLEALGLLRAAVAVPPQRMLVVFAASLFMTASLLALALRRISSVREELLRSSRLFEDLVREAPDAILSLDERGTIVAVNPAAEVLSGYAAAELRGVPFTELSLLTPEAMSTALQAFGRTLTGELRQAGEIEIIRRDGTTAIVEGHARRIDRDDGTVRVQVTLRDVTSRRRTERERSDLAQRLESAERLDSIGRLAGGVAHDFNNLLTVVLNSAALLDRQVASRADPDPRLVREITDAATRASLLVRQLLAFGRRQVLRVAPLDLNDVVAGMSGIVGRISGDRVRVVTELEASPAIVSGDRTQIEQVVLNLVVNARDAMPQGGTLRLRTETLDGAQVGAAAGVPHVVLSVEDDGIGMDEGTQARIFEPFFTTKGSAGGSGLGLSTVHGIVQQCGGQVRVQSRPGRGTRFDVALPCAAAAPFATPPSSPAPAPSTPPAPALHSSAPPSGPAAILVVDDDPLVLRSLVRPLEASGYLVLAAADPDVALALCERHVGPIRLLITDMVLPKMSGQRLAEELSRRSRVAKVLVISGNQPGQFDRMPGAEYLDKPFGPSALLAKVRELTGEPPLPPSRPRPSAS